jgi:hypothetical protein
MEVVVDGRAGLATGAAGATFRSIFEQIRRAVATSKRLVVSYTLDGEMLSIERQGLLADRVPTGYGLLEVKTIDPFLLSSETLKGLPAHVKNMEKTHDEATAAAAAGEYAKALEKFDAVFGGWDILLRAVRDVGALTNVDFRGLQAGDLPVDQRIRQLQDALLRFSAAIEFKDVPRIAEIVRDELRGALAHWRAVVESLAAYVSRLGGAAS